MIIINRSMNMKKRLHSFRHTGVLLLFSIIFLFVGLYVQDLRHCFGSTMRLQQQGLTTTQTAQCTAFHYENSFGKRKDGRRLHLELDNGTEVAFADHALVLAGLSEEYLDKLKNTSAQYTYGEYHRYWKAYILTGISLSDGTVILNEGAMEENLQGRANTWLAEILLFMASGLFLLLSILATGVMVKIRKKIKHLRNRRAKEKRKIRESR